MLTIKCDKTGCGYWTTTEGGLPRCVDGWHSWKEGILCNVHDRELLEFVRKLDESLNAERHRKIEAWFKEKK